MKTQSVDLLESAKRGNLDALKTLISRPLAHKDITVSVTVMNHCLTVTAEAPDTAPDQDFFVNFLKQGMSSLQPSGIESVAVRGKVRDLYPIVWRDRFSIQPKRVVNLYEGSERPPFEVAPSERSPAPPPQRSSRAKTTPIPHLRSFLWASSFLLGALLSATILGWFMPQRLGRTEWEYRIVSVTDSDFSAAMTTLGKDGWEMAYARRAVATGVAGDKENAEYSLYEVIFKRPKSIFD